MGDVWEATNVLTGRAVALKRLRRTREDGAGRLERARFVREAQAACAVEHPNVVEILDFVEGEDEPASIVMELLRGETLAARLEREQALSVGDTANVMLPAVSAVGTAHARGIVHRDLKPANIFLERDGALKVLDFGIAKWLAPGASEAGLRTETGATLGTPCYMAPEQAMGERAIDHRADIWAFGVILYECLSGMRPIEGENSARIMVRLLSTGIMPLDRLVPGVPAELAALVMRMLSREPSQRPRTLAEVYGVLSGLALVQAPPFGEPDATLVEPAGNGLPDPRPTRSVARRAASAWRRGLVPFTAAAAVAVVGAAMWAARARAPSGQAATSRKMAAPNVASNTPAAVLSVTPTTVAETALAAKSAPAQSVSEASTRVHSHPAPTKPKRSAGAVRVNGPQPAAAAGLPPGAACERSRECASHLCLAFSCQ